MTSENWERVKELLDQALDLPIEDRQAFLEAECGSDAELLAEVTDLLRAAVDDEEFLATPITPGGLAPGRGEYVGRVLGDFELVTEVGRGGMGLVYTAKQISLGRRVAVKVLPPSPLLTGNTVSRFQREAEAAGRLSHPAITPVHAVGKTDDLHWFAMEFVPGHDLHAELELLRGKTLKNRPNEQRFLPEPGSRHFIAAAARVVEEVARALDHAHQAGIVHRDVKPHNVLLDRAGHPHLVDFGLAKDESLGSLSRTGERKGTPHYMSPEQVARDKTAVDHRTDIYSLGVVLYELLTLKRPFPFDDPSEVFEHISKSDPQPVRRHNSRVPADLQTICETAMAKSADRRYASAGALADDLIRFLDHQSIVARPAGAAERVVRFLARHKLAGSLVVVAVVGTLGGSWWGERQSAQARDTERAETLEGLMADATWDDPATLSRLAEGLTVLGEVQADDGSSARCRDAAQRFEARTEAFRQTWIERAPAVLDGLTRTWDPDRFGVTSVAPEPNDEGALLAQVALLFPSDTELLEVTSYQALLPSISVTADRADARVRLRRIDAVTGEPGAVTDLGIAPVVDHRVGLGTWRILVEAPGHGQAEFDRLLEAPGMTLSLDVVLRPEDDVVTDMVAVPGGVWRAPLEGEQADGDEECWPLSTSVEVEPFLIDRHEVSVGEYRQFLEATGRQRPVKWPPEDDWDPSWERRPVTSITFGDARAYAEWVGKRLPTHHEWELAARGEERRRFPWVGGARLDEELANTEGRGPAYVPGPREAFDWYIDNTEDVDSRDGSDHPLGLVHVLGNVAEWTSTPIVDPPTVDEPARRQTDARWVLGAHWWFSREGLGNLATHLQIASLPRYEQQFVGLRCAKSLSP